MSLADRASPYKQKNYSFTSYEASLSLSFSLFGLFLACRPRRRTISKRDRSVLKISVTRLKTRRRKMNLIPLTAPFFSSILQLHSLHLLLGRPPKETHLPSKCYLHLRSLIGTREATVSEGCRLIAGRVWRPCQTAKPVDRPNLKKFTIWLSLFLSAAPVNLRKPEENLKI